MQKTDDVGLRVQTRQTICMLNHYIKHRTALGTEL